MVSDRDRAVREEMRMMLIAQIGGLTVMFDDQGPIYRYRTIIDNIQFITDQLNGDAGKLPSSL